MILIVLYLLKSKKENQCLGKKVIDKNKINILFVCMGNICRSPTAEGVFSKLLTEQNNDIQDKVFIDSAGTHAFHVGEPPDRRAQSAAAERGISLQNIRARKVIKGDFEDFDYILAMDEDNLALLQSACPEEFQHKLQLFLDYAANAQTREVPDPYYGGKYGFDRVLDLVESASEGLLQELQRKGEL